MNETRRCAECRHFDNEAPRTRSQAGEDRIGKVDHAAARQVDLGISLKDREARR